MDYCDWHWHITVTATRHREIELWPGQCTLDLRPELYTAELFSECPVLDGSVGYISVYFCTFLYISVLYCSVLCGVATYHTLLLAVCALDYTGTDSILYRYRLSTVQV